MTDETLRMNLLILSLLMAFIAPMPLLMVAGAQQAETAGPSTLMVLRGHVVCIDAAGTPLDSVLRCNEPGVRYAFLDKNSKRHDFSATDASAAIFTDLRVRQRELQITAQLTAKNQLELIRVQSIREGKLYDLYYFCELCNIRAYAPGLCPCCRNEMEFRETPATEQ
ncbi:MAG: hypothetical protein ACJ74J_10380 [Blastocatellia bacterium]